MIQKSIFGSWFSKKKRAKSATKKQEKVEKAPPFATLPTTNPKSKLKIQIDVHYNDKLSTRLIIPRENASQLTCEWLLYKVKQNLKNNDVSGHYTSEISKIVALKSVPKSIPIDYWLILPGKDLSVLPDRIRFEPVINKNLNRSLDDKLGSVKKLGLKDFDIYGLLGQGAFAKVYLGKPYILLSLVLIIISEKI